VNTLDIVVVAIIAISGLFAFVRGFVREALSIAAWAGAAIATIYGYYPVLPYVQRIITSPIFAPLVTGIGLFIISLIVLSIATATIATQVRNSGLSALDRGLGLLFGVARGVVLVCLGYLAATYLLSPQDRPQWMTEARSLPLLAAGAEELKAFIPQQQRDEAASAAAAARERATSAQDVKRAIENLSTPQPKPAEPPPPGAYKPEDRKALDRAFQSVQ